MLQLPKAEIKLYSIKWLLIRDTHAKFDIPHSIQALDIGENLDGFFQYPDFWSKPL